MRPGDLVIFYGDDLLSQAIQWATWGPSHVGMIFEHDRLGMLLVESTTLCPHECAIRQEYVRGVQAHDLSERLYTYRGSAALVPLRTFWRLSTRESNLLTQMILRYWIGRGYDTVRAGFAGTRLLKHIPCLMPYPDQASVFCSQLCAVLLQRLGRMPISNPGSYNPAGLVRTLRASGLYDRPQPILLPVSA